MNEHRRDATRRWTVALVGGASFMAVTLQACATSATERATPTQKHSATAEASTTPTVEPTPRAPVATATPTVDPTPAVSPPLPSPTQPVASEAVFAGTRAVVLAPVQQQPLVLAVSASGRVVLSKDRGTRARFVLVRNGDSFLIVTTTRTNGTDVLCLGIKSLAPTAPLALVGVACDPGSDDQQFTFGKERTVAGRASYSLRTAAGFVQASKDPDFGVYAQELGDAPLESTFALVDDGAVTAPALD